jgi:hypothetical protein
MDKRSGVLAGVLIAAIAGGGGYWLGRGPTPARDPSPAPSVTVAAPPPAPPATPAIAPRPPARVEAAPAAPEAPPPGIAPSAAEPPLVPLGIERPVVATDRMSGSSLAPTRGKPVAPVDAAWFLHPVPGGAGWQVLATLTARGDGERMTATFSYDVGSETVRTAETVIPVPRSGQAYPAQCTVPAGVASVLLAIGFAAADERGRVVSIPIPPPTGDGRPAADGSTPPTVGPSAPPPSVPSAPTGEIRDERVILQPAQRR